MTDPIPVGNINQDVMNHASLDAYAIRTNRFLKEKLKQGPAEDLINYSMIGLASEVGEVASLIKKRMRDGVPADFHKTMKSELGDVLWYWCRLAQAFDLNIADIMLSNIWKLEDRAARGTIGGSGDNR